MTIKYIEIILFPLVASLYFAKFIIHFRLLKRQKHPLVKDVTFFDVFHYASFWRIDSRIIFALWAPYFNKDVTEKLQEGKFRKVKIYQTILITLLSLLVVITIFR